MKTITANCVAVDAHVRTKEEAIRRAGQLLVDQGYIAQDYVHSLLKREAVANTFLGEGVAVPHGLVEDRHLIKKTGIAVIQVRQGVDWNPGQRVQLVVGIAAQSDEHIALLRRLTRLMQEPRWIFELVHCEDANQVVSILEDDKTSTLSSIPTVAAWPADAEATWTVDYPNGIHARPAARWVDAARAFPCEIRIYKGTEFADVKALNQILALGATRGALLRIAARGPESQRAVATLLELFKITSADEKSDADKLAQKTIAAKRLTCAWLPAQKADVFRGMSASPGLAIGKAVLHRTQRFEVIDQPTDVLGDGEKIEAAINAVAHDLEELESQTRVRLGASNAAIFRAQREMLTDPDLLRSALCLVVRHHGAAWSWQHALQISIEKLEKVSDPLLAARSVDLRDVGQKVLARLLGVDRQMATLDSPSILIAEELTPSDTLQIDMRQVVGLAVCSGGPTSHTAILARTIDLPAVVAVDPALLASTEGTPLVLDGTSGTIFSKVSASDLAAAASVIDQQKEARQMLAASRHERVVTLDGHTVEVAANVSNVQQAASAFAAGADAIGLMRTEYLFLERETAPTEEEQFQVYLQMVETSQGRPLIIRALDIGGDKKVPYLGLAREENPFLGLRGVRLLLSRQELLDTQLRALYRAAKAGPISIMFPMVALLSEVEALRAHCERVRAEIDGPRLKIGIMVEVPAVAVMAEHFAKKVDFFSIGTNDLTQYTLAVDRQHPVLAAQADSFHPAVLNLIAQTVAAAKKEKCWVGVCGGLAADPLGARILTGLGVDELSMSAPDIAAIKAVLRTESLTAMRVLAQQALRAGSTEEVRAR